MSHLYTTYEYVSSYAHVGEPLEIPEWGCWILKRPIGNTGLYDALGGYPAWIVKPNADIQKGLLRLKSLGFVSFVCVPDNYYCPSISELSQYFEIVHPFKDHYLYDKRLGEFKYSKHHRYECRQALKSVVVKIISLTHHISEWVALYQCLVRRHQISGFLAYPASALCKIASLDKELTTIAAFQNNILVSCHLWVAYGGQVSSFLAASNTIGYEARASYAIYDKAIQYFGENSLINFGGSAGIQTNAHAGLAKFKSGFANTCKKAYILGSVLDREKYQDLCKLTNTLNIENFFPAYRSQGKGVSNEHQRSEGHIESNRT